MVVAVEGVTMGADDSSGDIRKVPTTSTTTVITTAEPTTGDAMEDRLTALEDTMAALVASLRQEGSGQQVQQEGEQLMRRVEAVEGEVQRLEKRLESLEVDLSMLVFLDSRLRSTHEEQQDLTQLLNRAQQGQSNPNHNPS